MNELKPCSHCRNPEIVLGSRIDPNTKEFFFEIKCFADDCGITLSKSAHFYEPLPLAKHIIEAWNKRS